MKKVKILVLSIHSDGESLDNADYAIVLLNDKTCGMLKKRLELVNSLKKQDRDAMSVNFFGEPDLIISSDQFDEIFGENEMMKNAAEVNTLSIIAEMDTDAFNAIKSQTEMDDGLRLGSCDLRVYDDNFRWYLYEKYSGIEMYTNETMADQLKAM